MPRLEPRHTTRHKNQANFGTVLICLFVPPFSSHRCFLFLLSVSSASFPDNHLHAHPPNSTMPTSFLILFAQCLVAAMVRGTPDRGGD